MKTLKQDRKTCIEHYSLFGQENKGDRGDIQYEMTDKRTEQCQVGGIIRSS